MSTSRIVLTLIFLTVALPLTADQRRLLAELPQPAKANSNLHDDAWMILRVGLQEKRASTRAEAVQALSLLPGDRRATALALQALRDKDAHVRTAAAVVLGQQRAHTAIPELKEALSDSEISVALAAAHSLLLLKDNSAYEVYYAVLVGDRKSKTGLLQSQIDRVKDPKQMAQIGISEGMGFVPFGGMGYEAYRTIRGHDNSPVRAEAARFLAGDPDPISEDALIQTALADNNEIVRLAALDALAQRGEPGCIDRLSKNLDDAKSAVRYRTAAVIIHLGAAPHKSRKQ